MQVLGILTVGLSAGADRRLDGVHGLGAGLGEHLAAGLRDQQVVLDAEAQAAVLLRAAGVAGRDVQTCGRVGDGVSDGLSHSNTKTHYSTK